MTRHELIRKLEAIQDKCSEQVNKGYQPVDIFNAIEDLIEEIENNKEEL